MFNEYKQLDDGPTTNKPVVSPFNNYGLTQLDIKKILEAVNLIKEKRCGNIKWRTCANGRKQRNDIKPDESVYSPTCSTEALMETLVINEMEQRDVIIFNVTGDLLQNTLSADKFLLIRIRDEFVDVIWKW